VKAGGSDGNAARGERARGRWTGCVLCRPWSLLLALGFSCTAGAKLGALRSYGTAHRGSELLETVLADAVFFVTIWLVLSMAALLTSRR